MDQEKRNPVRHLTLEHWFVNHQLRCISKTNVHFPSMMDVDVTAPLMALDSEKPSSMMTSLLIRAVGLVMETYPEANRLFVESLFGPRLLTPPYIAVNIPVRVHYQGRSILSAAVIRDPHTKSVFEIRDELRAAVDRGLSDKPITRFAATRPNTWYNRMALRALYYCGRRFPSLYLKKGGGGASVTSVLNQGRDADPMLVVGFGPTAFTVTLISLWNQNGRLTARLGIGVDHLAVSGEQAVIFIKRLGVVLKANDVRTVQTLGRTQRARGPAEAGL